MLANPFEKIFSRIDLYWLMIFVLLAVTAAAIPAFGFLQTVPQLAVSVVVAFAIDAAVWFVKYKKFHFSKTAIITGLFVGGLLAPGIALYIPALASTVAVLSKHLINFKKRHVFNPTMLALVTVAVVFSVPISWWSALSLPVILITGIILHMKFWRWELVFTFLATYLAIFAAQNGFDPATLQSQIQNTLLLFFAFFMLVEPRTSPSTFRGRLIYGPVAAAIIYFINQFYPQVGFLLGLMVANLAVILINLGVEK